jgi:hypothetical protein
LRGKKNPRANGFMDPTGASLNENAFAWMPEKDRQTVACVSVRKIEEGEIEISVVIEAVVAVV